MINIFDFSKTVTKLILLALIFLSLAHAGDEVEDTPRQRGELYLPSKNAMADVDRALERAAANGRLALVILGANWCHDSRALAKRLYQEPLAELIEKHYETVFVDVGFYENGTDVIQRFGSPIYYATPTVLIVNPNTGLLVNADNRHQWANAYNISMEDSVTYFEQMAATAEAVPETAPRGELERLNAEIQAREKHLAKRVEQGFLYIGPLLEAFDKARKQGQVQDEDKERFMTLFKEFAEFRNAIPKGIQALHDEARQRVAAGEANIQLEYSDYPAFSWQSD